MINIRNILNDDIFIKKYTIKNKVTIVETSKGKFVLKKKKKNTDNIITYLKQRGFDNIIFPTINNKDYYVYPYIESIDVIDEQKAIDIITLTASMHNKTTFYKEVTIDYYKEIYENIEYEITYMFNYYNDLVNIIENEIYFSPSHYLLIRNISKLYACFDFLKNELDAWYKLVENKTKVRYTVIHNNLNIEHLINNIDKNYLINFDDADFNMPIYDILTFYKNHFTRFNFKELFDLYESKFTLLEEEKKLFFILISLPNKIDLNELSELNKTIKVRLFLDYLYKNEELITPYYETNDTKE